MKSLIIGGSGMIGSYLTKTCESQGYETEFTYFQKTHPVGILIKLSNSKIV